MAGRGWKRFIFFELDKASAQKAGAEMESTLAKAGDAGGKQFIRELRAEFDKNMAGLREKLARGVIDEKEFKKQSDKAARQFNQSLLKSMDEARRKGQLTDREYVKLTRTLKKVGDAGGKSASLVSRGWSKVLGLLGGVAVFFSVRGVARWTADIVKLGVAGAETGSKYETTFGAATAAMDTFIDSFSKLAGLSRNEAREFTATTGAMARGMGYTEEAAASLAQEVAKVAGDLTSFNDVPIAETSRAVRSALTGERESLKTLGIVVMETDVQKRALVMTGKALVKELTQQEKAAATLSLIQERMGPAQGDLVRTQDSLANASRRVAGQWRSFKEQLGETLVTADGGTSVIDTLSGSLDNLTAWLKTNAGEIQRWASSAMSNMAALAQMMGLTSPAQMGAAAEIASIQQQGGGEDFLRRRHQSLAKEVAAVSKQRDDLQAKMDRPLRMIRPGEEEQLDRFNERLEQAAIVLAYLRGELSNLPDEVESTAGGGGAGGKPAADPFGRWINKKGDFNLPTGTTIATPDVGKIKSGVDEVEAIHERAALNVGTYWTDVMDTMETSMENWADSFDNMIGALVHGGISGLARFAGAKAKEALAHALGATARGIAALANPVGAALKGESAAGHFASATKFAAEAAAWKALGAASGGSSGGASRAISAGAAGNAGGSAASNAQPLPPEIHVYLDQLSTENPAAVRFVYAAGQKGERYFGKDAVVHMHPGRGER